MIKSKVFPPSKLKNLRNNQIVLATHNQGKISEINNLLRKYNFATISAKELGLIEPIENGSSFEENAFIKASAAARASGLPALSDDSGLCINVLDGAPGIYSADWAGKNKDFNVAIKKVERLMSTPSIKDDNAKMFCALCLCWPNNDFIIKHGEIKGKIVFPPRGERGFGYDPIFVPNKQPKPNDFLTFGEVEPEFKNNNCHRSNAFKKLISSIL